jgi:hypothetical protein
MDLWALKDSTYVEDAEMNIEDTSVQLFLQSLN